MTSKYRLAKNVLARISPNPMADMMKALSTQKKTVNEDDMEKLKKFMNDFGQKG